MFMDELTPMLKELTSYPVAFLGGFVSGLLRLNLAEDPIKSWLDQGSETYPTNGSSSNGKTSGPQSITID